jgi:hypothetical protein
MTTVQLFHRIGRRAKGGDFTSLSMAGQSDIAEAANAALQLCYDLAPAYLKEQTQGFLLPLPLAITVTATQYSATLGGTPFTVDQIGRSVQLDGDPAWNVILGPSTLLNPYMGASGSVNGTVYGDAVYSTTYPFDRIIGNPMYANPSGPLGLYSGQMVNASADNQLRNWWYRQNIGVPQIWWTEMIGNSQGNTPLLVMRFAPAPSMAYSINVRLSFWPKLLTLTDYNTARNITVPDQFLETSLIPIAVRQFMSSPVYDRSGGPLVDKAVLDAADRGEAFLRRQPGQVGAPNNSIGTPFGY